MPEVRNIINVKIPCFLLKGKGLVEGQRNFGGEGTGCLLRSVTFMAA